MMPRPFATPNPPRNSFSTSADTLEALSKYPDLGTGPDLEFEQNKAPKAPKLDSPRSPGVQWRFMAFSVRFSMVFHGFRWVLGGGGDLQAGLLAYGGGA